MMTKKWNKSITGVCTLILVLFCLAFLSYGFGEQVYAAKTEDKNLSEEIQYSNLFYYQLRESGMHITRAVKDKHYNDQGELSYEDKCMITTLDIPTLLPVDGEYYPVEYIDGAIGSVEGAFSECRNLRDLTLPEDLKEIGANAFASCESLTEVELPDGLEVLGCGSFQGCTSLTTINIPTNVRCGDYAGEVAYPGPFDGDMNLTNVNFSPRLKKIGNAMFKNSGITEAVIPDTVTEIGSSAFKNTEKLKTVTISEDSNLETIGWSAFENSGINEIYLPDSLTKVDVAAFCNCTSLKSVRIPENMKVNDNQTARGYDTGIFNGCTSLTDITFADGITKIGFAWFFDSPIKTIVLPETVKEIGDSAFRYCQNLEKIDIADSKIETIGAFAFKSTKLKKIILPKHLSKMERGAFLDCQELESAWIPASMTYYINHGDPYGAFEECNSLKTVEFEKGTTKIDDGLLAWNNGLESIIIPDGVKSIGQKAFRKDKNLVSVDLPKSLRRIDADAFSECTSLKKLTFQGKRPTVEYSICSGVTAEVVFGIWDKKPDNWGGDLTFVGVIAPESGTSTDFRFYKTKAKYLDQYGFILPELKKAKETISSYMTETASKAIPGLKNTSYIDIFGMESNSNSYVPQGLCKFGQYHLITGYDARKIPFKDNSMLYVLDSNWKFVMNITLPNAYHNGGIAYDPDGDVLWFCGNTDGASLKPEYNVYYLKGSKLRSIISKTVKAGSKKAKCDSFDGSQTVTNKPSCLDYKYGRLWVGNFERKHSSQIVGYATSGTHLSISDSFVINTDTCVNGFTLGDDHDIYISYSSGRLKGSRSSVKHVKIESKIVAGGRFNAHKTNDEDLGVAVPRMNEELLLEGNYLYILYESAATAYYSTTCLRTDRITAIPKSRWTESQANAMQNVNEDADDRPDGVIAEGESVTITFGVDEGGDIEGAESRYAFIPESTGSYRVKIKDITSDSGAFITGEVSDGNGDTYGVLSNADLEDEENGIDVDFANSAEAVINLTQGNEYHIDLTAVPAAENDEIAAFGGQYTLEVERIGDLNKVEATTGSEEEQTVAVGGSSCFEFTPDTTGTYMISWDSSGMMSGSKVTDEDGNEVELTAGRCDLTAGKTYWFSSVLEDTYSTEETGTINFLAEPIDISEIQGDQVTIMDDSVVHYTADHSGRYKVMADTYWDGIEISVYDRNETLIAVGSGSAVFTAKAGEQYSFVCTGVRYSTDLLVEAYKPNIEWLNVQMKNTYTYSGKTVKPKVTVNENELILTNGTDYTVIYPKASVNAGKYTVTINGIGNYAGSVDKTYTINKAANPLKVKGKTVKLKAKTLKKKAQTIKRAKAIAFTKKGQGKLSYKLASVSKAKFKKYFKVNAKTGNITVKKGLKKGTYKVKVKVKAAGTANYKASVWKTVTVTIKVK